MKKKIKITKRKRCEKFFITRKKDKDEVIGEYIKTKDEKLYLNDDDAVYECDATFILIMPLVYGDFQACTRHCCFKGVSAWST
jgi:hypothetical protein